MEAPGRRRQEQSWCHCPALRLLEDCPRRAQAAAPRNPLQKAGQAPLQRQPRAWEGRWELRQALRLRPAPEPLEHPGCPPERAQPRRRGGSARPRGLSLHPTVAAVVRRLPGQAQALGRLRPRPPRSLRPRPAASARRHRPGPPRSRRAWPRTPGARASRSTLPAAARTGASSASPRRPRWPAGTPRRRLRSTRNTQHPRGRRARRGRRRRREGRPTLPRCRRKPRPVPRPAAPPPTRARPGRHH